MEPGTPVTGGTKTREGGLGPEPLVYWGRNACRKFAPHRPQAVRDDTLQLVQGAERLAVKARSRPVHVGTVTRPQW